MEPTTESVLPLKPDADIKTKVTIANLVETNVYEAPNIITVITDEDIDRMGYTDMLDILNNVPGIIIATDVQNGTSIGIRGNWAEEGKVLFMVDGLVMNDMAYGSVILGHRFPLQNISRIEIIRGAGSAIYGGLAALGVINIITKKGQEINGSFLNIGGGVSHGTASKGSISYNYGGYLLKGIELTATGLVNAGRRNTELLQLPDSSQVNFKDSSFVNDVNIQFGLRYKNFKFKLIYEDYNFQASYEPIASLARTYINEVSNQFIVLKKLKLVPYATYKWQIPWNIQYGDPTIYDKQNLITRYFNTGFFGDLKIFNWLNLNFGSQYYNNNMKYHRISKQLNSGQLSQSFTGTNAYLETQLITKYLNVTLAGRYEQYANFNSKLLPRLGLTKSFKLWHYKLLYGESYKLPTLQNINLNAAQNIVPEDVSDLQAELGFDGKNISVALVGFDTQIKNMILYGYDLKTFTESYINSLGTINTTGFEMVTKLKLNKFIIGANYSNYHIIKNTINEITVDTLNTKKGNLALPKHKVVASVNYKINQLFMVGVNYIYQTQKFSATRINSISDEYAVLQYPSTHLINVVAQAKGIILKIIDVSVGVNNILNTRNYQLYPFSSGYFNTLGMGREFVLQLRFNL